MSDRLMKFANDLKAESANRQRDQTNTQPQHIAEVVRHGEKLVVPEGMPIPAAIELLAAKERSEQQIVSVNEKVRCFPWDGAFALRQAMDEVFGIALDDGREVDGLFGKVKLNAQTFAIEVGFGQTVQVPWGQFKIAATDNPDQNWLQCDTYFEQNQVIFQIVGQVQRKYLPLVSKVAARVREIVAERSIYRGKAVRIRFRDEDGDVIPLAEPKFFEVDHFRDGPIFSRDIQRMVNTNVYTPLVAPEACEAAGVPFKRGVLLAGPFGTGKTLVAHEVAKKATQNGITFLYLEDVRELVDGLRFAQMYQPCVVFAEDLDRATEGDTRTVSIDSILNTLDGVDTKSSQVMVVCTTNNLERINQAILRPGRFDAIIPVEPPDSEAVIKLVKRYAGVLLNEEDDLSEVGRKCSGMIPAIIREIVERSKLEVIARTGDIATFGSIKTEDLLAAATQMVKQRELLTPKPQDNLTPIEKAARILGDALTTQDVFDSLPSLTDGPEPKRLFTGEENSLQRALPVGE